MKKKLVLLLTSFLATSSLVALAFVSSLGSKGYGMTYGEEELSTITISSLADAEALDGNSHWKQVNHKNNLFDFLGVESVSPITIKQMTYGEGANAYTYKGLAYNRSMINGFRHLKVDYTGSNLYATYSEYLMEDMAFVEDEAHKVTSGFRYDVDGSNGFFVLYTSGTVQINSIEIKYACDKSLDASLMYDSNTVHGYARSAAKVHEINHDLMELENNPTNITNAYSSRYDKSGGHNNVDVWYRWNGIDLPKVYDLGQYFSIQTTVIGNISQVTNSHANEEDNWFNFGIWPQVLQESTSEYPEYTGWGYAFIGNDNYDPAKAKPETDAWAKESYAGRFFGCYDANGKFADPDTTYTLEENSTTTLRDAYEAFTLPFWNIEIRYLGEYTETYINGFCVYREEIFYDYYPEESFYINRIAVHMVNYGNTSGQAAHSYKATFTTPRYKDLSGFTEGKRYLVGSKDYSTGTSKEGSSWNINQRALRLEAADFDPEELKTQEKVTVTFKAGDEWRIRDDAGYLAAFVEQRGAIACGQMHINNDNIVVDKDGTYDIYFKTGLDDGHSIYVSCEHSMKIVDILVEDSVSANGGWVALWAWKTDEDGHFYYGKYNENIVSIAIPSECDQVIFLRMASGIDAATIDPNSFPTDVWNQSGNTALDSHYSYGVWLDGNTVMPYSR